MWACLQDHDTTNHWKQVAGWRKVCDLAQIHLGRLQEYRRGLAEAWPPETSAASGTYLAQLDDLIAKVRHTHDAAAANYTALSAATQAIGATRAELRKLHEEYATKLQQKRAYEATAADPKAVMGNRVVDAPVTDSELEQLNVQARAMMFNLSGELQQAQATLQKPPPSPRVNPVIDHSDADVYGGPFATPVIPPIVPVPPRAPSTTHPGPSAVSPIGTAPTAGIGPVLGGIGGAIVPAPLGPASPANLAQLPSINSTPSIGATPMPPVIPARGSAPEAAPSSRMTNRWDAEAGLKGNPSIQPRPIPPGGLIGGMPGAGLSQPGNNSTSPRRINPVGGVIGGGGAGTGPTGGAGSRPGGGRGIGAMNGATPFSISAGSSSAGGVPGSYPTPRPATHGKGDEESSGWDPDHPWQTIEGVAPVVRPPDERGPIDPGPAIGFGR